MGADSRPDGIAQWRKSSFSGPTNDCIEVRGTHDRLDVRDSKDRQGPVLTFTTAAWQAFVTGVRDGDLRPSTGC